VTQTAGRESPDLLDQLGGTRGIVDATLPGVLFVVVYAATRAVQPALVTAVAAAAVLAVVRLVQRAQLRQAIGGLVGVGICAVVAARTGTAKGYYLPGILLNIAYGTAYLGSVVVRWPLLGLFAAAISRQDSSWRKDPRLLSAYTRASLLWVALFALKVAVQLPLYLADSTVALGVARVAMGLPLFALVLWLSFGIVRRASTPACGRTAPDG